MSEAAIILYTLIVVTVGGDIKHSRGYETLHMCEQAASIARTGNTLEVNQQFLEERKRREQAERDKWREAHPPRVPTSKSDLELVAHKKDLSGVIWSSSSPYSTLGDDGLIYDWPANMGATWSVVRDDNAIKYAQCVVEPPKDAKQ